MAIPPICSPFSTEEMNLLSWSIPGLARSGEFSWILIKYEHCKDTLIKGKWLALLTRVFSPSDQLQLEAILTRSSSDPLLASAFSSTINPIELGSEEARNLRQAYERNMDLEREMRTHRERPLLSPPPAERVALLLQRFEEGDTAAWWRLLPELNLEPNSIHYEMEWEADITALPGWASATAETRARLLSAARNYLLLGDPNIDQWLGKSVWHRPAVAGARAFLLLLHEWPDALEGIDSRVWSKWAATFLIYPASGRDDHSRSNRELVQRAYACAPGDFSRLLTVLIDSENQRSNHLTLLDSIEGCWDTELAEVLHAKCQDETLKPSFVASLFDFLLANNYAPTYSLAVSRLRLPLPEEGRPREIAIGAAAALLRFAPGTSWHVIWPAFRTDSEFGKAVFSSIAMRIDFQGSLLTSQLGEDELVEFFLWLLETYPEEEPKKGVWMGSRDYASGWRNGILQLLQFRGTEKACEAILRLMRERPELTYLKWSLQAARESTRVRSWKPIEPEHILEMARDSTKRLVRGGEDLLEVIIESLKNLGKKLQGETPLVPNLWNEVSHGVWEPKDEEHFSDNVKQHLQDELRSKGVVLNREVVIRRKQGNAPGERTDIHVDAIVPASAPDQSDIVTVVIEVKGCWNKDLWTAMKTQLADRYLHESHAEHGLYLVGWFNCPQWDSSNGSKKAPIITLQEAEARLNQQANELSRGTLQVKPLILDTSLR
jgi:hypothetical protein